jgi:large subunit ribosomal protein L29
MKVKDIRDLSAEDLAQKEKALKKELFDLNNQKRLGAVEKPSRFKAIRRDIARILTVLKERESTK